MCIRDRSEELLAIGRERPPAPNPGGASPHGLASGPTSTEIRTTEIAESVHQSCRGSSPRIGGGGPNAAATTSPHAADAPPAIRFVQGTVRLLPDLGKFDAVCAFYDDSLLSFADEADNLAALRAVARSLRPGGRLLFGTTDCPPDLPPMQTSSWREGDLCIVETIRFDVATRIGTSERRHAASTGEVAVFQRRRRHYRPDEAAALLGAAGFALTGAWCAYDEALPYGARPEGMVLAAARSVEAAR